MTVHYIEKIDIKTSRNSQGAHLSIGMAPMSLEKSEIYNSIGQIHVKRFCIVPSRWSKILKNGLAK